MSAESPSPSPISSVSKWTLTKKFWLKTSKGTVSVVLCDSPCKNSDVRFTMVLCLILCLIKYELYVNMLIILKPSCFFNCGVFTKETRHFYNRKNTGFFKPRNPTISSILLIRLRFQGTVVNRLLLSLHGVIGGSLEIMFFKKKLWSFQVNISQHSTIRVSPRDLLWWCKNHEIVEK